MLTQSEHNMYINIYLCNSVGKVKKVCETDLGIVTQCLKPGKVYNAKKQYFENVALKINVKVSLMAVAFPVCLRYSLVLIFMLS